MVEVEMKFPLTDFGDVERCLAGWSVQAAAPRQELDEYFNAPNRDFAQTDEALRLRRIADRTWLTYKGPKLDPATKTRTEVEVELAQQAHAADACRSIVLHLGYQPVALVSKHRRVCHVERAGFALEISLDNVDQVGLFVELEIQAPENRLRAAQRVLQEAAAALGLSRSERRSYLELLLAKEHVGA
jgi:adenylate cyclase class 2